MQTAMIHQTPVPASRIEAVADVTRQDVEEFLYGEALLLDDWLLPEWLALFTEDASYLVPTTSARKDASPKDTLFYIADDHFRLSERIVRLAKKGAMAEFPRSKTRHTVSNVLIVSRGDDELVAAAAFVVYRAKDGVMSQYVGSYRYRLTCVDGRLRIREKRCTLDSDGLRPQGRISIIL
jgi:p-cumate 2,3-dioxygenase subunit beta